MGQQIATIPEKSTFDEAVAWLQMRQTYYDLNVRPQTNIHIVERGLVVNGKTLTIWECQQLKDKPLLVGAIFRTSD